MRKSIRILIPCILAAWTMGCAVADTGAFGRLSDEVGVLRKDVNALKFSSPGPTSSSTGTEDISRLRKTVADMGNDSDRLRSEQLAVNSRMDETQAELGRALQENRRMADRVQELERRIMALESGRPAGGVGAAFASGGASSGTSYDAGADSEWKSPEEMYEYAVGQIKAGSPRKGRDILDAFTVRYPGHKLLSNAFYWKGESFYAEKDFENAILAFQDVVDKYPGSDKAPDAIYKQGLSFLALKDSKNAKILFNLVMTKYPNSPAAGLAKKQLGQPN